MPLSCSKHLFLATAAITVAAPLLAETPPKISREPLTLKKGGTPENPAVFDGQGMIIDLGIDVTDHTWKKEGDLWTSNGPLTDYPLDQANQNVALFIDEVPIALARDRVAERARAADDKTLRYRPATALQPGQMVVLPDGSLCFRWPASKDPAHSRIYCPPKPWISGVTIACSHIIVRNVTAMHAANDGFNIHNKWVGIKLENIRAFSNADEGISAHEEVQMDVENAEIAWNGSIEGGVADVNQCTTSYKNCIVHDNLGAAFKLTGKSHRVTDTVIYNQAKDFTIGATTAVVQERISHQAPTTAAAQK